MSILLNYKSSVKNKDEEIKGYLNMNSWKDEYRVILNKEIYFQYDSRLKSLMKYLPILFSKKRDIKTSLRTMSMFCVEVNIL